MKKVNFERIFFILINLCFTSLGAYIVFMLTGILASKIIFFLHHVDPVTNDNTAKDLNLFLGGMGLCLLYLMIKPICFMILYKYKKQFPYIHSFLDKFRLNRKFMWKILGIAAFFDAICCLSYKEMNFCIFVPLVFNYFIFLLFFHPVREDKVAEDGTIIQGKIANIMTNIFIWADIVLMIFIFILTILVFIT